MRQDIARRSPDRVDRASKVEDSGVDGRDNGQPAEPEPERQRTPSRADRLQLTRMPQIPGQRATRAANNPTGGYPVLPNSADDGRSQVVEGAGGPGLIPGKPDGQLPAPDGRRPLNRRVLLIAAGLAFVVAVPAGLLAAGAAGSSSAPGEVAAVVATAPGEAGGPVAASATTPAASPSVSTHISPSVAVSGTASPTDPATATAPATRPAGRPNPSGTNLALRAAVSASDSEDDRWLPANACDGDPQSRWSSGFTDAQWIKVDLRDRWQLSQILLNWEHAYAVAYRVETSVDGRTWRRIYSTTSGTGGRQTISLAGDVARYVRMTGIKRSNRYGYSLYEIEVR
ncbi:MAG TPA: discoidin domain-containing protein [Actinoplanes sp.]|nr:discoidin domain-containing protein [Actinoplanes sp.]